MKYALVTFDASSIDSEHTSLCLESHLFFISVVSFPEGVASFPEDIVSFPANVASFPANVASFPKDMVSFVVIMASNLN